MPLYFNNKSEVLSSLRFRLPEYLSLKKISTASYFKCLNPHHNDVRNSMCYDTKNNQVHCCGCGCSYDILDVIAIDFGLDDREACFNKACEIFNVFFDERIGRWYLVEDKKPSLTFLHNEVEQRKVIDSEREARISGRIENYCRECAARTSDTDYFTKLGLKSDILQLYGIGFEPNYHVRGDECLHAVIVPLALDSYAALEIGSVNGLHRYVEGEKHVFGDILEGNNALFLVQNEIDALILLSLNCSVYCISDVSLLSELLSRIEKSGAEVVYVINNAENSPTELTGMLCKHLAGEGYNSSIIDLSFPYVSIREFAQRSREKLQHRISELAVLLKPRTRQLKLVRNVARGLDKEQFTELDLEASVYGVIAEAALKRELLAHWLLATENRFLYCSSIGDWNILGMVMSDRIQKYGSGYSSRLSKISLYELGCEAKRDAIEILNCLLSQKIKLQKGCCLILNLAGRASSYVDELMRELCSGLRQFDVIVIVFDSPVKERNLEEFCCSMFYLTHVDTDDEDNPFEANAIKMRMTSCSSESYESYLSTEDLT